MPKSWPEEGAIEFEDVALRYADTLEPAVRDVTFSIKGGEKVSCICTSYVVDMVQVSSCISVMSQGQGNCPKRQPRIFIIVE